MHKIKLWKSPDGENFISEHCPDEKCEKNTVMLYYSAALPGAICPKCDKDLIGQVLKEGARKRADYFFDGTV